MKMYTYTFEAGEMKTTVTDRPIPTKTEMTRTALILAVSAYCHINHTSCTEAFAAVDRTVEQMRLMGSPLPVAIPCHFEGRLQRVLIQRIERAR